MYAETLSPFLSFFLSSFFPLCHSLFSLIPSNLLLGLIIDLAPPFPTLQSFPLDTLFCSSLFFCLFFVFYLFCWTVVSGCSRTNISWRGADVAVPATVGHLAQPQIDLSSDHPQPATYSIYLFPSLFVRFSPFGPPHHAAVTSTWLGQLQNYYYSSANSGNSCRGHSYHRELQILYGSIDIWQQICRYHIFVDAIGILQIFGSKVVDIWQRKIYIYIHICTNSTLYYHTDTKWYYIHIKKTYPGLKTCCVSSALFIPSRRLSSLSHLTPDAVSICTNCRYGIISTFEYQLLQVVSIVENTYNKKKNVPESLLWLPVS